MLSILHILTYRYNLYNTSTILSGENKNKYMFTYLSALVELLFFDEVYINFLIVGHTHRPNDQYFSVLSKKVFWARFIGSPISFDELMKIAHANPENRPFLLKRIRVIYNVVAALEPFINPKIKYYQVPHVFKITLEKGKAVFRYKLFSTFNEWLPPTPPDDTYTGHIAIPRHSAVGGLDRFVETVVGCEEVTLQNSSSSQRQLMSNINAVEKELNDLDVSSISQMMNRLEAQSDGRDELPDERVFEKDHADSYLTRMSDANHGTI